MTASERPQVRGDERSEPRGTGATATDTESAVVVDGVRKCFGSGPDAVRAVDDVSFTIDRGSVVGLLGPNGAGKTTLIKCVLGMVIADEGTVSLYGHDVYTEPRAAYARVDAMLEGARNDYWRLTVRENLRYFATVSGVDPDSVAARHDRLLDQLDLADKADTPVRKLSRGMKQKVSLASVLATESDVVFLDEPTLGLDVESSLKLRRELRRIVEARDLTVVLSSHDMDVIEDVCDRVIIMSDGRVIADDTVSNLLHRSGAETYRVTSPDVDDATVDALEARVDVRGVDRRDGRTHVEVRVDSDGFYRLVDTLREHGVTIDSVTTAERDLESVFVELTDGTHVGDGVTRR
jgi:ABC-2 type transport system ATP-binding protein